MKVRYAHWDGVCKVATESEDPVADDPMDLVDYWFTENGHWYFGEACPQNVNGLSDEQLIEAYEEVGIFRADPVYFPELDPEDEQFYPEMCESYEHSKEILEAFKAFNAVAKTQVWHYDLTNIRIIPDCQPIPLEIPK